MKKLLSLMLAFVFLFGVMPYGTAFADGEKVEITFCVGDSTLMINGNAVQVETPYVVGAGVTLVPLRVITEAFGATVGWIESTQTITLEYPDVNIVLQIGNPVAEVNGKAETLLSAPELPNSSTMVPLRFISETFGAVVSYDEATEKITVVKETSTGNTGIVEGVVDEKYIGDSYYGWTIENPVDMQMDERDFDGMYTSFIYDEYNNFSIDVYMMNDEFSFEKEFTEIKNSLSGLTLVKADKDSSGAKLKTMHFQAKNNDGFLDVRMFATDKYVYTLVGEFEASKEEWKNETLRIMDTFKCSYDAQDTYDLSNVKDGVRTYESEAMNFSIDVPANYYLATSESVENELEFYPLDMDDNLSSIKVGIYSISSEGTAKELAQKDYENNKLTLNEQLAYFGDGVVESQYSNLRAYEYTLNVNGTVYKKRSKDVFFELGDYVYNVNVGVKLPDSAADKKINTVINSIVAKEIDSSKIGILMRNVPDDEGSHSVTAGKWTMQVPNTYSEVQNTGTSVILSSMKNSFMISFAYSNANGRTAAEIGKLMQEQETNAKNTAGVKETELTSTSIGPVKYSDLFVKQESEDSMIYVRQLAGIKKDYLITVTITCNEIGYSEYNIVEAIKIVESLQLK